MTKHQHRKPKKVNKRHIHESSGHNGREVGVGNIGGILKYPRSKSRFKNLVLRDTISKKKDFHDTIYRHIEIDYRVKPMH